MNRYELGKPFEDAAAIAIEESLGCRAVQSPPYAHLDWVLVKDERLFGMLEVKRRRLFVDSHATTLLPVSIYLAAHDCARIFGVPVYVLLVYNDNVLLFEPTKARVSEPVALSRGSSTREHVYATIEGEWKRPDIWQRIFQLLPNATT